MNSKVDFCQKQWLNVWRIPGKLSVVALDKLHMLKATEIIWYNKPYYGEIGEYPAIWFIYYIQLMDIMVQELSVHHRQAVLVKKLQLFHQI